jgi:GNAT superfamily N-acetyltransferase
MESLYTDYLKERRGLETLADEDGFISYKVNRDECFIGEMFVSKDCRQKGLGRKLLTTVVDIARMNNCARVTANIFLDDPNASSTLAAAIACGFRVVSAPGQIVLLISLEIGGF